MTMTAPQAESTRPHPRRRLLLNPEPASASSASSSAPGKMRLKKGETFHTPTSPPTGDRDPVLSVRSLPRRSPTSLESIAASEQRMISILDRLTLESPEERQPHPQDSQDSSSRRDDPPVARSVLDARASSRSSSPSRSSSDSEADRDTRGLPIEKRVRRENCHESDSGLGSSISSAESLSTMGKTKVNDGVHEEQSAIKSSISAFASGSSSKRQLGMNACKQIERFILVPILKESQLKPFHPLVQSVPQRIVNKQIVCLRDLEKTLLWLAPKSAPSRLSYLNFCEFTIQCLHTSASHLNARDQRLPADRPYTNGYFLDLVAQVRRYAAMIRESQERVEAARAASADKEKDTKPMLVENLALKGGLSKTGKPAELVAMQDGKPISLRTGLPYAEEMSSPVKRTISFDETMDEGVQRSMARRKKNAPPMDINQKCNHCDKVFKRPCDLTKHEKTHSRPWKCTIPTCKYSTVGWPTEKERDRHINDKHSDTPALFTCSFKPCTYASKRESNCKQHMEKAHGWVYVRSKNNARGGSKRSSSIQATPETPSVATPASKATDLLTPLSGPSPSPHEPTLGLPANPLFNFADPPAPAHSDDFPLFLENSPYQTSTAGLTSEMSSFPTSFNLDGFQTQFEAGDPNGLIPALEMHRQSMNSMSVPSVESVPDLFDGSPLAHTENTSLNFDMEWSHLDMQNLSEDYTAMNMQLPTPARSVDAAAMKSYSHEMPMLASNQFAYGAVDKLSGLSPGAQGNLMLYSPGSGRADEGLSDHYAQHAAGNDFTLYEQNAQMGRGLTQGAPSASAPPADQYSQTMFPPLERDQILQGIQSWAEQQQGAGNGTTMPSDMELDFMG